MMRSALLCCVLALGVAFAAAAQDAPKAGKPGKAGKEGKERTSILWLIAPELAKAEPAAEAALMLTDDQKLRLEAAAKETIETPALVEMQRNLKGKGDAAAGNPDRKAAVDQYRDQFSKAQALFKVRVEEILTPDQKALVKEMQDAAREAIADAQKEYLERLRAGFAAKLEPSLTPEQKAAFNKAKEERDAREKAQQQNAGKKEGAKG